MKKGGITTNPKRELETSSLEEGLYDFDNKRKKGENREVRR